MEVQINTTLLSRFLFLAPPDCCLCVKEWWMNEKKELTYI